VSNKHDNPENPVVDYHDQVAMRKAKLSELRVRGNAYPNHLKPTDFAGDITQAMADVDKDAMAALQKAVSVCGRIMNRRIMGKASFIQLQDFTGRVQAYVRKNDVGESMYADFTQGDLGDIVYVKGILFRTQTNEITIHASAVHCVTKALRPMPDKFHGLAEKELCYRKRYVDLLANSTTRDTFLIRTQAIAAIRQYLQAARFLEVETPMMHAIAGGAAARPFITHHNALDMPLFMRIAPELFLKRLLVGGFDRVFEINRNFRNEGLSTRHNPEFTMLEFYQAYADYNDFMDFTEQMLQHVVKTVCDDSVVAFQGNTIDFSAPFQRLTMLDAICQYQPDISLQDLQDKETLSALAQRFNISPDAYASKGEMQLVLFEELVEKQLIQPTFITEYPTEVSPLSRRNDERPDIVDRCELFIGGQEVANIFSELNDPEDQAERFLQQVAAREAGDSEAMHYDADYIEALEYGMPPAAGAGIGIDRFVMMLTNAGAIRDVILFPLLKPVQSD
jgi:lysyl-tRNA synthetase class 2